MVGEFPLKEKKFYVAIMPKNFTSVICKAHNKTPPNETKIIQKEI